MGPDVCSDFIGDILTRSFDPQHIAPRWAGDEEMMTLDIASMRIGRKIQETEDQIDAVLAQLGALMGEVTTARIESGRAAAEPQRAIARLAAAQAKFVEARSDIVRAHEDLRRIAESADILTDCPPIGLPGDSENGMRTAA